jgi:hypothetical protein
MKEIILLTLLSGLSFFLFLTILIIRLKKKNRLYKSLSVISFFVFVLLVIWTVITFLRKSYTTVNEILKPRSGKEIYEALFEESKPACVKIIHFQDQVIPKIDYAIWMHLETCPKAMESILSKKLYHLERIKSSTDNLDISLTENQDWFNLKTLGDSMLIFEYSSENRRNIQTIWSNMDSTEVFIRDIYD